MTSSCRLLLTRQPRGGRETWDQLRQELRRFNLHLTILGLTPEGRPSIKLVGTKPALRNWLNQAGYDCVEVTS